MEHNPKNAHARFRRAFVLKALKQFEAAAADFECVRALAPDNPVLVVNYLRVHKTECVELCRAGEEPEFY